MAQVLLEKVTKVYPGGVRAVDGVDLSIGDREFVVLVGPSGCGKSTTLRMIAGLEEITAGTIRIGERVVNDVPPKDRDIAMVFQNYALYPHMTVYRNMAFGLMLRTLPGPLWRLAHPRESRKLRAGIEARVRDAARMLDIEHLLGRKPRQLSGGQRQRVALGRAIVREPAAFLFDEPLSNLDAKLRVTTRAELKRLHQRLKTTTIYVTHDQEEAMTLGDRIVVMKDGVIQQADTPLGTYNRPVNRFVAGFIGMPPMNFFHGMIRAQGDQLVFDEASPPGRSVADPEGAVAPGGLVQETVSSGPHELTSTGERFTLPLAQLAPGALARLGKWVGRHVVLGIRPEHLHLRPQAGDDEFAPVRMTVNVIEPLGNDMDVYLKTSLHDPVVARVEAQSGLRVDAAATLYVDLRKVHLFEPGETGMNLSLETLSPATEPAHAIA
jgi:multiple sugar transport system ATP-binding protein